MAVLVAFGILALLGVQALVTEPLPEFLWGLVAGLLTLYLLSALLGALAGRVAYLSENSILANLIVGVGLAFSCLILATLAGTVTGMLISASHAPPLETRRALEGIGTIVFAIVVWGSYPALVFGALYGVLVKITLNRKLRASQSPDPIR